MSARLASSEPDLSVAIVSYKSLDWLLESLKSFAGAVAGINAELCVVENGTGEPVREALAEAMPAARVVVLPKSVGFSAAVNVALGESRGRYVALLNPDTKLEARSLSRLVAYLDDHPGVGIVGPRVWDDADKQSLQRSWRRFPSLATALCSRYSLLTRLWPENRWSRKYLNLDCAADVAQKTDWVSGCCMVVRGTFFRGVGGMDEAYPLFCEDVDICRVASWCGYEVHFCPDSEIVHFIGGSRQGDKLRVLLKRHRSMTRYVLKYCRRWSPLTWMKVAGIWGRFVALSPRAWAQA